MSDYALWDIMIDSNTYRAFDPGDSPSTIEFLEMFTSNKPLRDSWEILRLKLFRYEGEDEKPLADFMSGFDVPTASAKAVEVFRPLLEQYVEFLLLRTEVGDYFALNVEFLDCLDVIHSVIKRAESDGSIIGVDKYAFYQDRIADVHMFRVAELGLNRLFVSNRFREVYEKNKFKGLLYYPVPLVDA